MFFISSAVAETVAATAVAETVAAATAAPEAAQPSAVAQFLESAFTKFGSVGWTVWLILGVLVVLGAILLTAVKSGGRWNAKMLAYAALSIALSFVLSCVRLYRMPQGGSVTPGSMLPLMFFAYAFGAGPGIVAGCAYGLLQYLQGGEFLNIWQFLLDYPIAFAALGLAGLGRALPEKWGMFPAMVLAVLGRALSAICAGLLWVAEYPVEGQLPFVYSMVYNGTYLIPEVLICLLLAALLGKRVVRQMRAK